MNKLTPEDFIFMQEGVISFNKMIGNKLTLEEAQPDLIETYRLLSIEELTGEGELMDSIEKKDKVGTLDGYIDCVFTMFYYACLEGIDLNKDHLWLRVVTLLLEPLCLQKELDYILLNLTDDDAEKAQINIITLMISEQDNFNFVAAFKEVLRSNYSKFAIKKDIDIEKELAYITSAGRYGELSYDEIVVDGKVYIAFKANIDLQSGVTYTKPKLIKCSTFSEPELGQFVIKNIKGDK